MEGQWEVLAFLSGLPTVFLIILNLSESSPITGLTFGCTGLYFFLAEIYIGMGSVQSLWGILVRYMGRSILLGDLVRF